MDNRKFKKPYKQQFHSPKQYDHFKTLGAVPLPTFPRTLLAPWRWLIQTVNNCTAYSGVNERFGVTGNQYDPEIFWQDELAYLGVKDAPEGVDLDTKMMVGIKIGFQVPGVMGRQDKALAYFWVKQVSGLDWFDSFRLAMLQLYAKYGKIIPITIGVNWYSDWDHTTNGILTMNPKNLLGGHDLDAPGFLTFNLDNKDYVIAVSSWGTDYGDNGIFRIPRDVFNAYFAGYGAAYWSDDPNLVPAKMNALITLLQNLVVLYKRLIAQKSGYPPPIAPKPAPAPIPPAPPLITPPTYLWDTAANARHSVRVICDEEGLTYDMSAGAYSLKEILCACIQVESGFDINAKHENIGMNNVVTSTDYGIVQVNDYFHIGTGKDFPSVQYVLSHSEECVRWMARLFKTEKGRQLWSSYKFSLYKKYL